MKRPFSLLLSILALAVLPLVAACGSEDDSAPAAAAAPAKSQPAAQPPAAGDTVAVDMAGSQFAPADVTVKVGQTIRWTNSDSIAHTVTATENATFDSGTVEAGGEFTYTTKKAGHISYVCSFHPGMTGTITVQ